MKADGAALRRRAVELLFGATAAQRGQQAQHRDAEAAYEARMSAPPSGGGVATSFPIPSPPPQPQPQPTSRVRQRDQSYAAVRKHFERIPEMFLDIEFYFAITGLGLFDHLIGLLLLPLKVLQPWRAAELRDVIALLVLAATLGSYWVAGVATTQLYSYLYHAVRRTSFIKLVMIFGILDVVDKLLSSFAQDSLEVLYAAVEDEVAWYKARRAAASAPAAEPSADKDTTDAAARATPPRAPSHWLLVGSAVAACASTSLHSLSLLLHVVTLNVTINAEGNSLLALLVGNNFTELKSVVFKKNTPESLHGVCALDALERMQYVVFFVVMLLHHMHERFSDFAVADVFVILCVEVAIDFVKNVFVSRFNGIPPSVFRAYSQLTLLDLSGETVLWRLPSISVVVSGSAGPHVEEEAAELLAPAWGFAPKNVKRAGFDAIAYAALLLWSCGRVAGYLLQQAPLVCLLVLLILVLVKLMLAGIVYGVCARFTLRTLVVAPPSWPPLRRSVEAPVAEQRRGTSQATPLMSAWGVRLGVSPISTPRATPIPGSRHAAPAAATPSAANGRSGGGATARTLLRLTPLLLALLKVDRFDLQAGKAKRVF